MDSSHISPLRRLNHSLPEFVVQQVETDIVPQIVDCCRITQEAYDLDPENNNNYTVGTYSWNNLYWRLLKQLDRKQWVVRTYENDLTLSIVYDKQTFEFRVHRCSPDTRVPTGGSQAKACACGNLMLSEEIEDYVRLKSYLTIGYDLDPIFGLGSITIDQLSGTNPSNVIAFTLATLYRNDLAAQAQTASDTQPEQVVDPEPTLDRKKGKRKSNKKT